MVWYKAYEQTYPELKQFGKDAVMQRYRELRYRNVHWKQFLAKRGSLVGIGTKMSKNELLDNWLDISRFNMAELYEMNEDGTVRLKHDWLEHAKKHNVINRIVVTRKTIKAKSGEETVTETTDIVPYSRTYALSKIGNLLGYDENSKITKGNQTVQNNNLTIVGNIESIKKALMQKQLPGVKRGDQGSVIDVEFVDKMTRAKIVKTETQENGDED